MNYKYFIILTAILGIMILSCKKELDLKPNDATNTEDAFNTIHDFNAAVNGMYALMYRSDRYLGGTDASVSWISTLDLLADNLLTCGTGRGSQRTFHNWVYTSNDAPETLVQAYKIARAANAIIINIPKIKSLEVAKNIEAEALAVRAMVHFDLLRLYSKPLTGTQADPGGLGITYIETLDVNDAPERGQVNETYAKIVRDLEAAAPIINVSNGSAGRLNKAAVYGLLSRVYLYGGEWQKAVDAATQSLTLNSNPGTIANFKKIWTDDTEEGVLFKVLISRIDLIDGSTVRLGVAYNQTVAAGIRNEFVPAYSLFELYKDEDVRKLSYVLPDAPYSNLKYNAIIKYLKKGDASYPYAIVDLKYLRVAEVLLNRAEAYFKLNQFGNALADLNSLRKNRYENFVDGTETGMALEEAIALERRLELAFEGDRWFDLKRKGLPVKRDDFGDRADGSGNAALYKELAANDYRWQLPIPVVNTQTNPNFKQNPGY